MRMLFSPSCARNKAPIADALTERVARWTRARLAKGESPRVDVLELACGTGEHASHVARALAAQTPPHLGSWQPTDKELSVEAAASVRAWSENEGVGSLIKDAKVLNCMDDAWEEEYAGTTSHLYVSNLTHISEWAATVGLLRGAGRILTATEGTKGCIFIYGASPPSARARDPRRRPRARPEAARARERPLTQRAARCTGPFRADGKQTAPSNEEFDLSLRQRNAEWGIRCRDTEIEPEALRHGLRLVEWVQMPANNMLLVLEPDV